MLYTSWFCSPFFIPTHLLKLIPLSSRLSHHERHSPQDKVELLTRAGEVAHGEGLVSGLQALQQSGGLEGDGGEGVLERYKKQKRRRTVYVAGGPKEGAREGGGRDMIQQLQKKRPKKTVAKKLSRQVCREHREGFARKQRTGYEFLSRPRRNVPNQKSLCTKFHLLQPSKTRVQNSTPFQNYTSKKHKNQAKTVQHPEAKESRDRC